MSEALMKSIPPLQHNLVQGLYSDQAGIGTAKCPFAAIILDYVYDDVFIRKA